jgi:hypothetical protein
MMEAPEIKSKRVYVSWTGILLYVAVSGLVMRGGLAVDELGQYIVVAFLYLLFF